MKHHPILVVGHKNPDIDSVASAIAYARLKELEGNSRVIAGAAGQLNRETSYVLNKLGIQPPHFISDVKARVEDLLDTEPLIMLHPGMKLGEAANLLRNRQSKTLAITDNNQRLLGVMTVGDLAMILLDGVGDPDSPEEAGNRVQGIMNTPLSEIMKPQNLIVFDHTELVAEARDMMLKTRFRNYPVVDEGNQFMGMISRYHLLGMKRKPVILVDHNEKSQAVEGIEEAELLEIVDHHRVGDLESISPIYFRNEPVGATCTLIAKIFLEKGRAPDPDIAGLLLSGILSDTMIFKSPTTTETDREMAAWLAELSGLDKEEWGREIFQVASPLDLSDTRNAIKGDLKEYKSSNTTFAVAQIETADMAHLEQYFPEIQEAMEKTSLSRGYDLMFLMVTDIFVGGTQLLIAGEKGDLGVRIFSDDHRHELFLKGVLSRKKQIIPIIFRGLAQNELV
ncbi:MAG: putative manganese-dependent inorganic diphosphatase [Syntrophomonadaceae bacterium]|nr:putative manganese-dependent inorganic diphosphatase [Syntrophomonadaceae bacterium]